MPTPPLILASERTAAKMFDISCRDFLALVESGCLPKPTLVGGQFQRWRVAELEKIASGAAARPEIEEEIEF